MIQISTFPAAPSTERVPSLAERVASLRYSINLQLLNNRVPGLVVTLACLFCMLCLGFAFSARGRSSLFLLSQFTPKQNGPPFIESFNVKILVIWIFTSSFNQSTNLLNWFPLSRFHWYTLFLPHSTSPHFHLVWCGVVGLVSLISRSWCVQCSVILSPDTHARNKIHQNRNPK